MNAFTQVAHRHQLDLDEPPFIGGENPCDDDIISNVEESRQFRIRLTFGELRRRICEDYTNGFVNAANTMRRLEDEGLYGSPDEFCKIFAAGVSILSAGGTRS